MNRKQKKMLTRIIVCAALMIALHFVPVQGYARLCLYLVPYLIIGWDILKKAAQGILSRQIFDENFLMAVATIGAIIIGAAGSGDYVEAVAVMLFYQIGELFQSCAVGKSRRSIAGLMDIRPDYANVEREGTLVRVSPEEVEIGTVIVVQPGERIPLDGVVLEGSSEVNTSALTGESLPRFAEKDSEVISGCVNMTGLLRVRTTRTAGESTASKILELVENASSRKSRPEAFITRFARVYTPLVCAGALLLAVLPPIVRTFALGLDAQWNVWIYRALTFLVISCPCALVISIPLTFFAGLGGAGRRGILIKGSNYLEALSRAETVVFDKTGTLTEGSFRVTDIHAVAMDEQQLLECAALAESGSSHPIARSILKAYGGSPDLSRVKDIRETGGQGVTAVVDGRSVAAGNHRLMENLGIDCGQQDTVGTVVHVAIDGAYGGYIVIADKVKDKSAEAITALRKAGVGQTIMLTGDSEETARKIAGELGIDRYAAQLLPDGKVKQMEEIMAVRTDNRTVIFAGDGINDAPVLARADVGVAMGAMGSDAAIEAADVVLMDDDPMNIPRAVKLSRECMAIVRQNIVFALGVKAVCLALGALGIAGMWLAVFADVGVMILAVLNAVRALNAGKSV